MRIPTSSSGGRSGSSARGPWGGKKGADKGIDGRLYFHDEGPAGGKTKQIIISVKAGNVTTAHVRDLRGVLGRETAEIGVLISMEDPTQPMRKEAATAGFYSSPWGTKHPRIQLLTVAELLDGRGIDYPMTRGNVTFKKAPPGQGKGEGAVVAGGGGGARVSREAEVALEVSPYRPVTSCPRRLSRTRRSIS